VTALAPSASRPTQGELVAAAERFNGPLGLILAFRAEELRYAAECVGVATKRARDLTHAEIRAVARYALVERARRGEELP